MRNNIIGGITIFMSLVVLFVAPVILPNYEVRSDPNDLIPYIMVIILIFSLYGCCLGLYQIDSERKWKFVLLKILAALLIILPGGFFLKSAIAEFFDLTPDDFKFDFLLAWIYSFSLALGIYIAIKNKKLLKKQN